MLSDRQVVVMGGSSGIAAAERLGGRVATVALDAHDEEALEGFFSESETFDHLVSMVGDSMAGGFLTTTPETMRHVLHSKFWTNWMIARYAAPKVRDGGSLTFTSGTGGRAQDVSASYVANLGIAALVQGLASELAPGARVNAVAPTFMGTETMFWRDVPVDELEKARVTFRENVPLKRLGTAEEVASAYIYLMANGFITGQVLAVDGGVMLRK